MKSQLINREGKKSRFISTHVILTLNETWDSGVLTLKCKHCPLPLPSSHCRAESSFVCDIKILGRRAFKTLLLKRWESRKANVSLLHGHIKR